MQRGINHIWYVAYGSNMCEERFLGYLGGDVPTDDAVFRVPYLVYFAGESAKWDGGVAFIETTPIHDPLTPVRAWLLCPEQFDRVLTGENGQPVVGAHLVDRIRVGEMYVIPVDPDGGDPRKAKYNALFRLPDIDGIPAVTITTSRDFTRRAPSFDYAKVITRGLEEITGRY